MLLGGSPSLDPATNDFEHNSWSIGVSSGADIAQYKETLTARQVETISNGWILSLTLRVGQPVNPGDSGIFASFGGVGLNFGSQTNDNPAVALNYSEYDFNGGGSGYHNYQLKFDSTTDLASLWIDGTEWLTGIQGSANPSSLVWGEIQHASGANYYANWNKVSLWAVPEPSALSFIFFDGGVFIYVLQRRRH